MLREHIRTGDAIGAAVADKMKAGSLVSDELVNQLVFERVQPTGLRARFYPRRIPADARRRPRKCCGSWQGVHAEEVVIHLVVDYNVIISRISGRRVCPKCGTLYNAVSRPPKIDGVCDLDGTALVVREDDREEVVRQRLAAV